MADSLTAAFFQGFDAYRATAWEEGYQAGKDDAARQSMIAAGLREPHTNPYQEKTNDSQRPD